MIPCRQRRSHSMKRRRHRQSIPTTRCPPNRERGQARKMIRPLLGKWFNRPTNGRLAQPLMGRASRFAVPAPKTSQSGQRTKTIHCSIDWNSIMSTYKLYSDWTAWWPLVHPPEGCAAEAAAFCQLLHDAHPHPSPDQPQTTINRAGSPSSTPMACARIFSRRVMKFLVMTTKRMGAPLT